MIFLGIWSAELYLDNYTAAVPLDLIPKVADALGLAGAACSVFIIYRARKAATIERQTVLGGALYLALSVVFMAVTLWQKPLTFYLQHERIAIKHEIKAKQEEIDYIDFLKKQIGMSQTDSVRNQLGFGAEK